LRWVGQEGKHDDVDDEFSVFVGVDWGSELHQVCVMDESRQKLLEEGFAHSGKGLTELVEAVLKLAGRRSERVAVAIEVLRGPVVDALLEKHIAVFAINPKQLDRFRDRHSVAGAKDDRSEVSTTIAGFGTCWKRLRRPSLQCG
jgi:hypothetical protein